LVRRDTAARRASLGDDSEGAARRDQSRDLSGFYI